MKKRMIILLAFFVFATAGSAFGAIGDIYNVDLEQYSWIGTFKETAVGPGPDGGVGDPCDLWNVLEVSDLGVADPCGTGEDPNGILLESKGGDNGVYIQFISDGTYGVAAWGHSPTATNAVNGEYWFLGDGGMGSDSTEAAFTITGLTASQYYDMYLYCGGAAASGLYPGASSDITVDSDGDGDLSDETPVAIAETYAPTVVGAMTDSSGTLIGLFADNGGSESEWSGFQLHETTVPVYHNLTMASNPTDPNSGLNPVAGVYSTREDTTVNISVNLTYILGGNLWVFSGWSYTGDAPASTTAASTSVVITQATTITANYTNVGPPPNPNVIVNVDFEQLEGEGTYKQQMVGPGPNGGIGDPCDYWNVFEVSESGTAAPISMALKNDANVPNGVSFIFTSIVDSGSNPTNIGAYGHLGTAYDDVTAEYLFLGPQGSVDVSVASWEITGLSASTDYSLYLYTGGYDAYNGSGGHNANYNIDVDGDGVKDGWNPISPGNPAPTLVLVTTDASGIIHGDFGHPGSGEAEIGGFQLGEAVTGVDLTINAPALSSISPAPGVHGYPLGTIVSIDSGGSYWDCDNDNLMLFDHWEDDLTGSDNPAQIVMTGNKTVTAVYVADGSYVPTCGDYCYPTIPNDPVDDCVMDLKDLAYIASYWLEDNRP